MCGRFTLQSPADLLKDLFLLAEVPEMRPRYNVAPGQDVAVVVADAETGDRRLQLFRWGLVPFFAKDPAIGNRMINARAETLAEKPSFRAAYKRRRCLVPADGFYEWRTDARGKTPCHITLKDRPLFAFAGLWESWKMPTGDRLRSFTIITTSANEKIAEVHDRMPVILDPEAHASWLDPKVLETAGIAPLLVPYPADRVTYREVSRRVNDARCDEASILDPLP